jgi:predicted PurR-regulated permease PerM
MHQAPDWTKPLIRWSIWRVILYALITIVLIWMAGQARSLLSMIVISLFFGLALIPGVNWLHENRGWRRGAAVGFIYLSGFVFMALLVTVLIPAIAQFADAISGELPTWLNNVDAWTEENLGVDLWEQSTGDDVAAGATNALAEWGDEILGAATGLAATSISLIFNLATIAMFTFYFAAEAPRIQQLFLSRMSPATQQRMGWTWDEAIAQTGGYFYSRMLIMLINGTLFFFVMLLIGMPLALSLPLSIFEAFVATFIPAIGTYIGSAIPILITIPVQGWTAAIILLIWVLIYQQIENYWLSPKLSSKTMTLNGGVAFGAALAGGAIAGPMGAFMSLPIAALITSIISNYTKSYDVVYQSRYDVDEVEVQERKAERKAKSRLHRDRTKDGDAG